MTNKERTFIAIILLGIGIMTSVDLYTDMREGVLWWHASIEATVVIFALIGVFYLLKGTFLLKHSLSDEKVRSSNLQTEANLWKEQSKKYIDGLSHSIDLQLTKWGLTSAEKEVAFLLLKGFSLKEVAEIRNTSEKTARAQSTTVYAKAGITSRSQLSAFFLEDLLVPADLA
jgi:DNA-binding CsgD family transcriptional regulator